MKTEMVLAKNLNSIKGSEGHSIKTVIFNSYDKIIIPIVFNV